MHAGKYKGTPGPHPEFPEPSIKKRASPGQHETGFILAPFASFSGFYIWTVSENDGDHGETVTET